MKGMMVLRVLKTVAMGTFVFACPVSFASSGAQALASLSDLTVPPRALPEECSLASRFSIGLHVRTNPWIGTDRQSVASIRERVDPVQEPDAQLFIPAQRAAYRLKWAEGVEEAYVAVYQQQSANLVVVYGLRFGSGLGARTASQARPNPGVVLMSFDEVSVLVQGDRGACTRAIGDYLRSIGGDDGRK